MSIFGILTAREIENNNMETLKLTQVWDKKFPQSDKVNHHKVTFKNRFGIEMAADLYEPKNNIPNERPAEAPQFILDYWDFYMSPERGYIDRAPACSTGWTKTTPLAFINTPLDSFLGEIETPVLLVHGEKAHSRYFSEEAFVRLKVDNKRLMIIPKANHTDLYDNLNAIPYNEIEQFFKTNLK